MKGQQGRGFGLNVRFSLGGRRTSVRRGDVRAAILALLSECPMHGYQIIGELAERSGGAWRPSAGSVYPTLQQLDDEGLVRVEEREGRRTFDLTEPGRVAAANTGGGAPPWEMATAGDSPDLRRVGVQVMSATMQIAHDGDPHMRTQAYALLADCRRSLYRLLAEDDAPTESP